VPDFTVVFEGLLQKQNSKLAQYLIVLEELFLKPRFLLDNKIHESLSATKARLRYRQLELENINQVALAVNRDLDLDHVLNRIMQTIEKIYPFESLYVVNYIPEGLVVLFVWRWTKTAPKISLTFCWINTI